ncbi:TPA: restriction endonuclease subunit S, partial [Mannheimia haemolytica]|nr:restriction endonuclease subunit S [Mannheimia haemolytica]
YNISIGSMSGTGIPRITLTKLESYLVPVPPLLEQQRIVQKIEELLPLVERYEQTEQQLTKLNNTFPEQLKKSVLHAAIQGKLTEQDPNDELASCLIERIKAEKNRLIAEKKLKKPKSVSEIVMR